MLSKSYTRAFSDCSRAFSHCSRAFSALFGLLALVYVPTSIAAEAAETPEAVVERAPIETIEDALDQPASPLDSVAERIANTEYDEAEEFLTRFIRAIEAEPSTG